MEARAIREYRQIQRVNYFPCGFVIHPAAPRLGSSPDLGCLRLIRESPIWILKCPDLKSHVDNPRLKMLNGKLGLKQQHACIRAEEDTLIQRIYRDSDVIQVVKEGYVECVRGWWLV